MVSGKEEALALWRAGLRRRRRILGLSLAAALAVTALWRLFSGPWDIPLSRALALASPWLPPDEAKSAEALVIRAVRLPRLLAALGTGGILSVAGVLLQGLLHNSLADPYTLGIASGAALGAALGLLCDSLAAAPMAFCGAAGALWGVHFIARRSGGGSGSLILAGVIVSSVLQAGVTFLKAIADDRLSSVVLWLMGSLAGASPRSCAALWCAALVVAVPAWVLGPQLDALALGDDRGSLLGVDERSVRAALLLAASLGTAVTVSFFGIIGFLGLVVPHLLRLLIGPQHRTLVAFSFLFGGTLLTLADGFASRLGELPVGVLTALLGGPVFCRLLIKRGRL